MHNNESHLHLLFVFVHPMKLTTTRWRMMCAKMKSAKARSGLMPSN